MAGPDDWELLDELMAVIRRHPADETLNALITCLAKVIVMNARDDHHIARMIEATSRHLPTVVDFQKAIGGGK